MILHDWQCAKHGVFESTHAICPHLGCASTDVKMVFLKAPGMISRGTKQFDAGMKQTATQMNLLNFRSAREGETAHGGELAKGMLWGKEAANFFGGQDALVAASQQGIAESNQYAKAAGVPTIADGMRTAATDLGITKNTLPPAEVIYAGPEAAKHSRKAR
jgi:hypothetical protein